MEITIFIRPEGTGYRATCAAPVPVSIQAPTRDEALAALRREVHEQLRNGEVVRVELPASPVALLKTLGGWRDDPTFDDLMAEIQAAREVEQDKSKHEYMNNY
jgi:hypothetical protein